MSDIYSHLLRIQQNLPSKPIAVGREFEMECFKLLLDALGPSLWYGYDARTSSFAVEDVVLILYPQPTSAFELRPPKILHIRGISVVRNYTPEQLASVIRAMLGGAQ